MEARLKISAAELVQIIESIVQYNGYQAQEIIVRNEQGTPITVPSIEVVTGTRPLVVRISEEDENGLNGKLSQVRRHYGSSISNGGGSVGSEGGEGSSGPSAAVGPVAP